MQVLVLAWDAPGVEPDAQAVGLAETLASGDDEVCLVTREGAQVEDVPAGFDVLPVGDAPPIVPAELAAPRLSAEAFAARAMAGAVRWLRDRPSAVVHAVGWWTGPVVAGLQDALDVPVVARLTGADVAAADDDGGRAAVGARLARDADAVVVPTRHDADVLAATSDVDATVVPPGVVLPRRSPGPPPARGPLHLTVRPGASHRAVAARLRGAIATPRRITQRWHRRPFAVVVLDPHAVDAAVRALAAGVPLLAVEGPVGELATTTGGGLVVPPDAAAVGAAVDRLAVDPTLAAALGEVGAAAAVEHGWATVAARWRQVVVGHLLQADVHLHAAP